MKKSINLGQFGAISIVLAGILLSSVAPPAVADSFNRGFPTTNIGNSSTWLSIPRTYPIKKTVNNRVVLTCPKGFAIWEFGLPATKVSGNVTVTNVSYDPTKFLTTSWAGGGKRKVRQLTPLCQKNVYFMAPKSRAELSEWTFVGEKKLAVAIGVRRPPVETCIPAVAPTSWEATIVSNDLASASNSIRWEDGPQGKTTYSTALKGAADGTGVWTIRWKFMGGDGYLSYFTRVKDKDGLYALKERTVLLEPSGTEFEFTEMLSRRPATNDFSRASSSIQPGIVPDCGQRFLPAWRKDWYGDTGESTKFDVGFVVSNPLTNPEITLQNDGEIFDYS